MEFSLFKLTRTFSIFSFICQKSNQSRDTDDVDIETHCAKLHFNVWMAIHILNFWQ